MSDSNPRPLAARPDALPAPLPGARDRFDLRDPIQALARFYRAFNERDGAVMEQVWEHSPEVAVISPLVGLARGWSVVRGMYERGFQGPLKLTTEFYDYTTHRSGEVFYAIGRERAHSSSPRGSMEVGGQATNILRQRPDGTWAMIHHHVSVADPRAVGGLPAADPS